VTAATAVDDAAPLLRLRGVVKNFGAVQALKGVDLDIPPGQVTALVGDNGAGKSTLIKSISGIWSLDGGQMVWDGNPVRFHSPREASSAGIATVYQDLALCDNLDIVQNMFLGRELLSMGLLDEPQMEKAANKTLADLHVTTVKSIRQLVQSLSGGQRQAVAVARAVMEEAKLVILDEPTAALGVSQTAMVLDLVKRLSSRGIAVLIISHNLNDVFAVADRVAVLHLGTMAEAGPISDYDTQSVVELITTGKTSGRSDGGRPDDSHRA
jgi:ABC-type sugar transport system ATPase subunit